MSPNSKLPEGFTADEEEKAPQINKIEISADKNTINCEPDEKVSLKINVTNKGTMTSKPLKLRHEYFDGDKSIEEEHEVCQGGDFNPNEVRCFIFIFKAPSKSGMFIHKFILG